MGFLAPWFLAGIAGSRPAGLPAPAAARRQDAAAVQLVDVLRAAHAKLHSPPASAVSAAALAAARPARAAGARLCQSLRQPPGGPRGERSAGAAGGRHVLQHARRLEADRCQARGALRARVSPALGTRPGDGARFAVARAHATDGGRRDRARGADGHSSQRLPRQLRRARPGRALDGRQRARADCTAPVQRHAAVEHGAERRGHDPAGQRHAGPSSRDQDHRAQLGGRARQRPRPVLGHGARRHPGARPGHRRRLRHAGRHPYSPHSSSTGRPSRRPACRCRRRVVPRWSFRLSRWRTASAAARSASIRPTRSPTTMRICSRWSVPIRCACSSCMPRTISLAAVFQRRADLGRRIRLYASVGLDR